MNIEEALVILDAITKPGSLNDTEEIVFRQSWQGLSYPEIAAASGAINYSDITGNIAIPIDRTKIF